MGYDAQFHADLINKESELVIKVEDVSKRCNDMVKEGSWTNSKDSEYARLQLEHG